MAPQKLSKQRLHEVQRVLANYKPAFEGTDVEQLAALCKAVLNSIDVRDLKRIASAELVGQLESVLHTIKRRKRGQIMVAFRVDGDTLVIESCMEDQPFLVSSVRGLFAGEGLEIRSFMNAVAKLRRDAAGILGSVGKGVGESILRIELALGEGGVPEGLEDRYRQRLKIAQAIFQDFQPMKRRLQDLADDFLRAAMAADGEPGLHLREAEGMVRWLCDENYVLLSVEEYALDGAPISGLGMCAVAPPERDAEKFAAFASGEGSSIAFQRSPEESPVHRAGKPGHFMVRRVDRSGEPVGTCLINGLFTYKALHTPPEEIPLLRLNLRSLLADRGVSVDSHRGKALTNAFNSLPLEFLLTEPRESVWDLTDRVLRAEAEGESDVHIRVGAGGKFVFAFVSLPKEMFSDALRLQVQDCLKQELGATYADFGVYMDRYDNAIVHFYLTGPETFGQVDTERVRRLVLAMAKGWNERLREVLAAVAGEEQVEALFDLYANAFTEEAKRRVDDVRLRGDVACIETLRKGEEIDCDLYISTTGDHPGSLNLRVFKRQPINLSDELPLITSFGFSVIDEYRRPITIAHERVFEMDNFRLDVRPERTRVILGRRKEIRDALRLVFSGAIGRDVLNQLVVTTTMTATEVEVLRAYVAYLHQLRCPFETELIRRTLVTYPTVTQALMAWLVARFDPNTASDELVGVAERTLTSELKRIRDFTADRVFQAVAEVVRATLRTNAFIAKASSGEPLAFKFKGDAISYGPEPRPFREIWVFHPDFEGVHLRGGLVARGGLRFSDRPNDFRTEIHGLMATQRVKNVLIVPMGAKGGFVLRRPPSDRKALRAAGDHYYRLFIQALLSVTDNVVDGATVTPPGILHREQDDPYLVVAADKGTAHLSDTANAISSERGFWLDDAFASGGSQGYDHKATGITARGAWETTRRHFHELGVDPESDVITVIGVGDMSGDVFGNGLLRSRSVKLLAAFNHIEIFIDPDPDPEASFVERARLFKESRSWSGYDAAKLSPGGGVFERKAKRIELSPQARALLGVSPEAELSGEDVIHEILKLDVDLMWQGGIGTYIKGKDESHAEVGDKSNDSVRVNASELRCKVLAEGANLAITDRARVEFARGGGHNYTSFLDNSGGVDTSDHEVNIKILFAPLLRTGVVTRERRNELLAQCEEQVCEMVLANNRSQSRMVSFDVRRSRKDVYRYSRALHYLVRDVPFNPDVFGLPTEDELASRARKGGGLYKCDASALGAYAKMLAYRQLLAGEPLPAVVVSRMLRDYFPPAILEEVGDAVDKHLLKRELATTMVVNRVVENAGASFFAEVIAGTRRSPTEIAWAYLHAADACEAGAIQRELYALEDKHRQDAVYEAMERIAVALEEATFYLLDHGTPASYEATTVGRARELFQRVDEILPPRHAAALSRKSGFLEERGIPESLARRIARLDLLTSVLESIRMADETGRHPSEIMRLHVKIADQMHIHAMQEALSRMVFETPWEGLAAAALSRQLTFHLHKMVRAVEGDDVAGMIKRLRLQDVRKHGKRSLESGVTISGLVMFDHHLRRLLPAMPGGYRGYTDTIA